MPLVTREDDRRVLALGLVSLLPAAAVTLLLVHQPSIGSRRVYPLLRGALAFSALAMAAITVAAWVLVPTRGSRRSLSGLAWAAVATLLCIGPLVETAPRERLYALDLATGEVVWTTDEASGVPTLVAGDLVVTDADDAELVGLEPTTGRELWRSQIGAQASGNETATLGPTTLVASNEFSAGHVDGGPRSSLQLPGEDVVVVVGAGANVYAYVRTPGSDGVAGGAIVQASASDGTIGWRVALPMSVVVATDAPSLAVGGGAVVVAGGERVGVLDAADGGLRWSESVVTLGKSRGYVLPGAVQRVVVAGTLVFLSLSPGH